MRPRRPQVSTWSRRTAEQREARKQAQRERYAEDPVFRETEKAKAKEGYRRRRDAYIEKSRRWKRAHPTRYRIQMRQLARARSRRPDQEISTAPYLGLIAAMRIEGFPCPGCGHIVTGRHYIYCSPRCAKLAAVVDRLDFVGLFKAHYEGTVTREEVIDFSEAFYALRHTRSIIRTVLTRKDDIA